MFKKLFGERPPRALTVQQYLAELLLLGIFLGLMAGALGGFVMESFIVYGPPSLEVWWQVTAGVALLGLAGFATRRYLLRTEQRLALADDAFPEAGEQG